MTRINYLRAMFQKAGSEEDFYAPPKCYEGKRENSKSEKSSEMSRVPADNSIVQTVG